MNDNTKQFRRNCARQCPAAMSIRNASGFGRTLAKASASKSKSGRAASCPAEPDSPAQANGGRPMPRRSFLRGAGLGLAALGLKGQISPALKDRLLPNSNSTIPLHLAAKPAPLLPANDAFLEELSRRAFRYFWENADARTGLVRDRALARGASAGLDLASIAATGFGLTALAIAAARGWVPRPLAEQRALATLEFFAADARHQRGWFYHYYDMAGGRPAPGSEVSSMDTALLLAGMLSAGAAFPAQPRLAQLAEAVYRRVDFRWMLAGDPHRLSMGWLSGSGFLAARWDSYCEETLLYLLAIGSESHPIPAEAWQAIDRPWVEFAGFRYVAGAAPLFIHQYSHAWVDYRHRRDTRGERLNYFANSIAATRAQRAWCATLGRRFRDYGSQTWGITASESRDGYVAWGGPPAGPVSEAAIDGTIVPCAAAGSLMFTPRLCLRDMSHMLHAWGPRLPLIWGRYGFCDAFNPLTGWASPYVLGINQGITLLSAENFRSGRPWQWFMHHPAPRRAMARVGLNLV